MPGPAISKDLTRNENRLLQPVMGRQWSYDSNWDLLAMSNYNTVTSLSESPLQQGLIYAGTDDGLIQVTENGGQSWRKAAALPGVPKTIFINDIKADLHDANTVYAVADHHKGGDLEPYVFKSTNRGKSWKNIASNLPARHIVWRLVRITSSPACSLSEPSSVFSSRSTGESGGPSSPATLRRFPFAIS